MVPLARVGAQRAQLSLARVVRAADTKLILAQLAKASVEVDGQTLDIGLARRRRARELVKVASMVELQLIGGAAGLG